ncbi:MAG: MarC family protein [Candidatus Planktophila sp.]|jgi:multiple antibiotic resistance protein|nr:MarC family protein [Candidatus Planktophila sp.]
MKIVQISALTFAIQSFVTLFVIMDPPGATPVFLALVADKSPRERRILAIKAAAVSFLVITLFALFGRFILSYLNISMAALQAAGALLLLLISLDLLTGGSGASKNKGSDSNIALVPLGTPLLAGPGAIVATMIFVQNADTSARVIGLVAAVVGVHIAIAAALMASTFILKVIKQAGVTLVARIAGLLLAAIAVQMLVNAIRIFISE